VTVVVVGDALLDRDVTGVATRLSPDAPVPVVDDPVERARPGGAALAAVLAAADGEDVVLVTALGDDDAGRRLRGLLEESGVAVLDLGLDGRTPEKVRVRADGQSIARLDYGGAACRPGSMTGAALRALAAGDAVLVADYGRGVTAAGDVRAALAAAARRAAIVWDPHPRGAPPVPGVRLATPNRAEARHFAPDAGGSGEAGDGDGLPAVTRRARALAAAWSAAGVSVTLGARGALLVGGDGTPLAVPAPLAPAGDPCGAGDRFAAAAVTALAAGALPSEAVQAAVAAASAFVAAGGAAAWPHPDRGAAAAPGAVRSAQLVAAGVRERGGTVVATGGCFDLLHAGHVRMLAAARALGDCLVVCLNSDDSVRRLKGPERPLVPAADRAAVLRGLGSVDAVTVFDEDTPEAVLERLRPDIWAKGADYAVADLPEAGLLERWGGQAVVLPYLDGRSTTRLVHQATLRKATP